MDHSKAGRLEKVSYYDNEKSIEKNENKDDGIRVSDEQDMKLCRKNEVYLHMAVAKSGRRVSMRYKKRLSVRDRRAYLVNRSSRWS